MIRFYLFLSILSFSLITGCKADSDGEDLIIGAVKTDQYLPSLKDKSVGLLINHTSMVGDVHLVDFLISNGISIEKIFAPEHGFRGKADAGEKIDDNIDAKTGISIVSIYGKNRKPTPEMMDGLDVVVFDIQDVGTRFYTYISSMHYMMEACAENNIMMMVLDRPNPNGHYIDGPILNPEFKSFVGMHPIPIVHGLTVGELANMINGESWLKDGLECDLKIVPMENYNHSDTYRLPIKPSPNLPNDHSIYLYPSLCFFEGTNISIGRGTEFPFQVIGYPNKKYGNFSFTPKSIDGMAKHPKLEGETCYGVDLRNAERPDRLDLSYLISFYNLWEEEESFFIKYFNTLAGTDKLRKQIESGMSAEAIRATWQKGLDTYKKLRSKYLLYED